MLLTTFCQSFLVVGWVPFVQAVISQVYTFNNVKADGIGAVYALLAPPTGALLLSGENSIGGYVHNSLSATPKAPFSNPAWNVTVDFDYAGNDPAKVIRLGSSTSGLPKQIALSTDSGASWSEHPNAPQGNWQQGKIALSADGDTIIWLWSNGVCLTSRNGNLFGAGYGCAGQAIASDKRNNTLFYATYTNTFMLSTNQAFWFTATTGKIGESTAVFKLVVNPRVSGDVWASSDTGLYHTVNSGDSFKAIAGFIQAWSIALGAPAKAVGYPSIFAAGVYQGVTGLFRSDDQGVTWVQINNAAQDFGAVASLVLSGDWRTHGRVYIGTSAKGIVYGDIA